QRTRPYLDQAFRRRRIFRSQASPGRSATSRFCLFGPMRPKGLHLPQKHEPKLLALPAQANRYFRRRLRLVALACGLALRACVGLAYRPAIATAAKTVGMNHAQSPIIEMAIAATMQPTRKPISRRRELFNRPRSTGINGR